MDLDRANIGLWVSSPIAQTLYVQFLGPSEIPTGIALGDRAPFFTDLEQGPVLVVAAGRTVAFYARLAGKLLAVEKDHGIP